jgi:aryl-alcohol dehydrogenase-like predicted oxidoreductase
VLTGKGRPHSRRQFLQCSTLATAGLSLGPHMVFGQARAVKPMKRPLGQLGFEASTLGLGGQASLQWTPADVDPVPIILKAFALGVNYFDTSNAYGPSQANYGKAFPQLHLIPGQSGYDEARRRSIFLTSKTGLRWAKGKGTKPGLRGFSNGPQDSGTVDDVKRTLSQVFGDGSGQYPPGAYLDMVLIHHLTRMEEIDALYEGLSNPDPRMENIGALAALVDYRDGTNLTGLNPKEEKLIRHIGFSGHHSPPVMMEMIQRDERGILEGMLVAINANDRLQFNMQFNVIPVARARNMALIGMKTFADGAMYTKPATWSSKPEHVVRTVGSPDLPCRPLIEYSLSTPGIQTLIVGIGQIAEDGKSCQLEQNLAAAQVPPQGLSESDRRAIEKTTALVKEGKTNYFQLPRQELTPPREAAAEQEMRDGRRLARLRWQTAYAGDEPILSYEIWRDQKKVTAVPYTPQTSKQPFVFEEAIQDKSAHVYQIKALDAAGRPAATADLPLPNIA